MTPEPGLSEQAHRCAVLGRPIGHSLSPALHRAAYEHLRLTGWSYEAYDVGTDELAGFVATLDRSWRGLSLTMPLKQVVLALGEADATAALVGAGNTLIFEPDGRRLVHNTDVGGLVWALRRAGVVGLERVVLLGAGATARSALVSVAELGGHSVTVVARRPEQAATVRLVADRLGVSLASQGWELPVPSADLIVSTAPTGVIDDRVGELAAAAPAIVDVLYEPWPTPLASAATTAGGTVVSGLDLLVGQALLQITQMTGRSVPAEVLYAAGQRELATRGAAAANP